MKRTIAIDMWNQKTIEEIAFTLRVGGVENREIPHKRC